MLHLALLDFDTPKFVSDRFGTEGQSVFLTLQQFAGVTIYTFSVLREYWRELVAV